MINENSVTIRPVSPADIPDILNIYAPYVKDTAITFEYDVPSFEEFSKRVENIKKRYPFLVAEKDGKAVGYAYASPFHDRPAYDWSVETSIYVDGRCTHEGLGRKLHDALEAELSRRGFLNMCACIAYPKTDDDKYLTKNSAEFHSHLGYRLVGEFHDCGYKFGRWYNMIWMEKHIGEHILNPKPPF